MTKEINKQEQAKRQNGLWTGLTVAMVLVVGLITLSGCNSASNANTGATNANTGSTDKIYKVDELAAAALADKATWTGREVTITGYIRGNSDSGGANIPGYTIFLVNDNTVLGKNTVWCQVPQGNMPEGMISKTVEVKGKIKSVEPGEDNIITLDPCEIKK